MENILVRNIKIKKYIKVKIFRKIFKENESRDYFIYR